MPSSDEVSMSGQTEMKSLSQLARIAATFEVTFAKASVQTAEIVEGPLDEDTAVPRHWRKDSPLTGAAEN